jgi:hypothetical protein
MTMSSEAIAHVCHEANRALQKEQNDPTIPVSVKWEKLDEETRASAVQGVANILGGIVKTPRQSHEQWCQFKRDHGWTLGPVKDETKKEHPLLVDYDELPESQRITDSLFFAIVSTLGAVQTPLVNPNKTTAAFREGAGEGQ